VGEEMKNIKQLLVECSYKEVFETLNGQGYVYSLESIAKDFADVEQMNIYCYLLYVLSREETCKNHILICDFLMFQGTFFYDIYPVIDWHLRLALKQNSMDLDVLCWIVDVFYEHPDTPFSDNELLEFAQKILLIEPDNSRAKNITNQFS
jgi:hypothetical protein